MVGQERTMTQEERESLMRQRDAFLLLVDDLERRLGMTPRTSELRKEHKQKEKEEEKKCAIMPKGNT